MFRTYCTPKIMAPRPCSPWCQAHSVRIEQKLLAIEKQVQQPSARLGGSPQLSPRWTVWLGDRLRKPHLPQSHAAPLLYPLTSSLSLHHPKTGPDTYSTDSVLERITGEVIALPSPVLLIVQSGGTQWSNVLSKRDSWEAGGMLGLSCLKSETSN